MFQPLACNAAVHRLASRGTLNCGRKCTRTALVILPNVYLSPRPASYIISLSFPRSFATTPPPPTSTKEKARPINAIPSNSQATRKGNTDFRPAPRKPTALSTTHMPTKPNPLIQPSPKSSDATTSPPRLASAKEIARKDVEEAEVHGVLAPPPADANWFKRTLHKAIQLAKFYYRGVKLIFIRRKDISLIRARIRAGGVPLSRWENRFIRTQKDDVNKVIPFLFIALLLEEVIPLIAIYAPFMLPSTCILPSQRARIEGKKADKALAYSIHYKDLFPQLERLQDPPGHLSLKAIRVDDSPLVICGMLRLATVGIDAIRIRRIRNHLQFITLDDNLLLRDNALENLSAREVNEALEERGFITQDLDSKAQLSQLKSWLNSIHTSEDPIARRLFLLVKRG